MNFLDFYTLIRSAGNIPITNEWDTTPEAVAMLVSFPTNVHKLRLEEDIPGYDRFSEKGSKTSKNPKFNRVIDMASIWPEFSKILKSNH